MSNKILKVKNLCGYDKFLPVIYGTKSLMAILDFLQYYKISVDFIKI